jgi:sugar fermentation stimulation protein A
MNPASKADAGLYLLILKIPAAFSAPVGALRTIHFKAGMYVYCGSARRNLSHRLARHLKREKKMRWHIDYLTASEKVVIEHVRVFSSMAKTECSLNLQLQKMTGAEPVPGFGCSDCSCSSHLTYFEHLPDRAIQRL